MVPVCLSVCHSVSRITHKRVYECRPNMVGTGKGHPLEVIKSWCWCAPGCGSTVTSSPSLSLRHRAWYDIFLFARGRYGLNWVCALWAHLLLSTLPIYLFIQSKINVIFVMFELNQYFSHNIVQLAYKFYNFLLFLPRDAMHKPGLCRRAVSVRPSVCLSVCLSRSCILSKVRND